MIFILDGSSENFVHEWRKSGLFEKYFKLEAFVDANKSLKQLQLPYSFYECALYSDIPSFISTIDYPNIRLKITFVT